ncbi:cation-transporting P-type ATPase, partial [Candidatus Micrarchaeota archaeon]|nr:cation-transporting P-type ATPase [Candidatus Micrarchaeota archaeon]
MDTAAPWALPIKDVFYSLKSSDKGLLEHEANERFEKHGPNEIAERTGKHGLHIFVSQFKNALILLLIGAAIIAYFLGETIDSIVILAIVFLNAILGFFQEYKAEKALRELRKYVTVKSKVLRNGKIEEIDSRKIVPGDIVYLSIGDIVPADIRLISVDNLSADESSLTGESMPVEKIVDLIKTKAQPQQLKNMAFAGTSISSGYGYGVVTEIGKSTFLGKTASFMKEEPKTEFEKNIAAFSAMLLKITVTMALFVFVINALLGKGMFDSFLFAVALAVGITPEMLPIIVTISLSNGAMKMAKEKVVIKRLESVEDLGNIDVLCCDKTGTLTEGKITLQSYLNVSGKKDDKVLFYGMLCNSVKGKSHARVFENAMDRAIFETDDAKALEPELENNLLIDTNEFDYERKMMSVVVKNRRLNVLIAKGAPESIIKACDSSEINGKKHKLSAKLVSEMLKKVESYENDGYRVIAVAEKPTLKKTTTEKDETNMSLIGFLLFFDPPKQTAREALETFEKLGVLIKIISGDSPLTTRKVCEEVGLPIAEGRVVTGDELEKLDVKKFAAYAMKYNVFARVTPEQKHMIVKSLSAQGHIVGFLGDGVNDAPALEAADIGISMGITGTDVAKEASDMLLADDNFATIISAVEEGRSIFERLRNVVMFLLSTCFGE